jgi:hypothetical protein
MDVITVHVFTHLCSSMKNETGEDLVINTVAGTNSADVAQGFAKNNYSRPSGSWWVRRCIFQRVGA